jgi:hypothetical protein
MKTDNGDVSSVETVSPVSEPGQTVLTEPVLKEKKKKRYETQRTRTGRPNKSEIQAKLKPGKVGRPAGDYQKARELCARMLVSSGDRMIETLIKMALTDGHPNQIAAMKMCLDRSLPISYFENKSEGGNGTQGIVINITGVSQPAQIQTSDDVVDVEVESK